MAWLAFDRGRTCRRGAPRAARRRIGIETLESRLLLSSNRLYYDWIEEGELQGSWIERDPQNPFHYNIAPATVLRADATPPPDLLSSQSWVTVVDNGPSSNRIDLVFVGDGYTSDEIDVYAGHVENAIPKFFSKSPLDIYFPYFNIHRVDVVSPESGVDNDPSQGIERNTALDAGFFCQGIERLLCVNVNKATQAARSAPEVEQILVLANTSKYGGAGYASSDLATFAGGNASSIEIGIHEFGHSFADLADEYDVGGPETYTGDEPPEPNVTILDEDAMAEQKAKWHLWLDHPEVGTFERGKYSKFGIYRPTANSQMRSLGLPFGPVNSEQIVLSVYRSVRPIDEATPEGVHTMGTVFQVKPVQPAGHSLDVQWKLDGQLLGDVDGHTLDSSQLDLAPGKYVLSVTVTDRTELVRDEEMRQQLMTQTRQWLLVVPEPEPEVVGRFLYYKDSAFAPPGSELDDSAIAPPPEHEGPGCELLECGKLPLLGGETATFHNYSNYVHGINGIVIDIAHQPGELIAEDLIFRVGRDSDPQTWTAAPQPERIATFVGQGIGGSTRNLITWANGSIVNTWLEVTVLPNERTGLSQPDVHYWGSAVGDSGDNDGTAEVDPADFVRVLEHAVDFLTPVAVNHPYDMNRDGLIDGTDLAIVRDFMTAPGMGLPLIAAPVGNVAVPSPSGSTAQASSGTEELPNDELQPGDELVEGPLVEWLIDRRPTRAKRVDELFALDPVLLDEHGAAEMPQPKRRSIVLP